MEARFATVTLRNEGALVACHGQLVSRWEIMKQLEPNFLALISYMCGIHNRTVDEKGYPVVDNPLPSSLADYVPEMMTTFAELCAELGLIASVATLERLRNLPSQSNPKVGEFQRLMNELHWRIQDELKGQHFFCLTLAEADKFENWGKGWEKILERFPETSRDVEEMNKCFALDRYTAAMFHALHVAEWGAIRLGDYIGIADPRKGWGPTERKLKELIKNGHVALPASLVGKFEFLEQMHREIDSLVLAWRNKVDHAANHLAIIFNSEFTPDIAEHIIGAVRIYMQRLIEGIPA